MEKIPFLAERTELMFGFAFFFLLNSYPNQDPKKGLSFFRSYLKDILDFNNKNHSVVDENVMSGTACSCYPLHIQSL